MFIFIVIIPLIVVYGTFLMQEVIKQKQ